MGLIEPAASLVLGGPDLADPGIASATRNVARLMELLASLQGQALEMDSRRFARYAGFSVQESEVLAWGGERLSSRYFARADLVRTSSGFKLLELNVGGAVGGMAYASMPMLTGRADQVDPPLRAWSRYVARYVRGHGRGAIVEAASLLPENELPLRLNAAALAETCDCPVDLVSQENLQWSGERLLAAGKEVGWIYPIISPRDVCADMQSYKILRTAIEANAVALPFDFGGQVLGSKLLLSTLWELADAQVLPAADENLVRTFVPYTKRLATSALSEFERDRAKWVLKPALGYGGHGVFIGREHEPSAWSATLQRAVDTREPHVLQAFCQPVEEEAVIGGPGGTLQVLPAHFVWGVYVAEGTPCGEPVMRCRSPGTTLVINYANGAMGGMLRRASSNASNPGANELEDGDASP